MAANDEAFHKHFHKKARFLFSQWKDTSNAELFQNVDAILLLVGDEDDDSYYAKSVAAQTWLLGFPFNQTLILLTPEKITFLSSTKKCDKLESLQGGKHDVALIRRGKTAEENAPLYSQLIEDLKGKRVGVLLKDKIKGKIVDEWGAAQASAGNAYESVDVSAAVSACLAVKDEEEVSIMRSAAKVSSNVMKNYFIDEMSTIIDEEKKVTHVKLSDSIESTFEEASLTKKIRLPSEVDVSDLEWCYNPIVQSGGKYDLRSSGVSNKDPLHGGVILCSLGARYKYYCSNIGRTFLIDPSKVQEKNYEFLLKLQEHVLNTIRDGAKIKDIYEGALSFIDKKRPDLVKHFTSKDIGFGMGIIFRETTHVLKAKNPKQLKNGMVLNLALGFSDLENPNPADERSKIYSLLIIDTVLVSDSAPVVLTDCTKKLDEISFFFKDDEEKDEVEPPKPTKKEKSSKSAVLRSKFRSEEQEEESNEQKRQAHQKQLFAQKLAEGIAKYSETSQGKKGEDKAVFRKFESYRSVEKLPREAQEPRIIIDRRNDSIILPIYGMAVPFHISTLKNASKSEEGDFVMLRLNFMTPGQPGGKKESLSFDDANATFVRALTFRSANTHRMAEVFRDITDLKKQAAKKEAERKEMSDVVEQDKLIALKGGPRLREVYVRPQIEGKRLPGDLEIHQNGLRYQAIRSEHSFNVLFSNVKHLFFQPCDKELLVLIHVYFKNPIMTGKKKIKEIQFTRDASEVQFDETGNKRRRHMYGDEDELESEQEERRRRANLNREFKTFAEKIADASEGRIEVDIPFRELGFQGVPFRTNVLLQPTTDCLVHLTDPPFLVITLNEIEIAHLERVQFGLKNFDMVFVFKDYSRTPMQINTIPTQQLDNVKDWLDSVEVAFTEGPVNLNWSMIMKTVNQDPAEFFKNGGWNFLADDEDANEEDESDSASEFEMSEEEFGESSSDESDFESNASAESEEEEDLSDSGEDWDELEDKARQADERKLKRSEEQADTPRKKVRR